MTACEDGEKGWDAGEEGGGGGKEKKDEPMVLEQLPRPRLPAEEVVQRALGDKEACEGLEDEPCEGEKAELAVGGLGEGG